MEQSNHCSLWNTAAQIAAEMPPISYAHVKETNKSSSQQELWKAPRNFIHFNKADVPTHSNIEQKHFSMTTTMRDPPIQSLFKMVHGMKITSFKTYGKKSYFFFGKVKVIK